MIHAADKFGVLIIFYATSLFVSCLICTYFSWKHQKKQCIKRSSLHFLLCTILGVLLFDASLLTFLGRVTAYQCRARYWAQITGYGLILASLIAKMKMNAVLVVSQTKVRNFSLWWRVLVPIIGSCCVQLGLLTLWTLFTNVRTLPALVSPKSSDFILVCSFGSFSHPIVITLLLFNGTILALAIAMAVYVYGVEAVTGETAFAPVIVASFLFVTVIMIPVLQSQHPSENSILLYATTIWILSVIVLGSIYVPKICSVYYKPVTVATANASMSAKSGGGGNTSRQTSRMNSEVAISSTPVQQQSLQRSDKVSSVKVQKLVC
ncbi:hypothetical protein BDR26DRAFT_929842 [Obelidium mucronatum]|nr:hypothetical protein BDR26DRAFT_929842 [Obelidium mucronatum]